MNMRKPLAFALSLMAAALMLAPAANAGKGYCDSQRAGPGMSQKGMGQGCENACPHMAKKMKSAQQPGKSLGVLVSDISNAHLDENGLTHGVHVADVQADSAAQAAGLQAGDIIQTYAGKPVYSADRLRWLVRQTETGKATEIQLLRGKESVTLNATLAEPKAPEACPGKGSKRWDT